MTELPITAEQRANLLRLAHYLLHGPRLMEFNMGFYMIGRHRLGVIRPHNHECGTVACAAGHGPAAGIEPFHGETWYSYTRRCFIGADLDLLAADCRTWCFASDWARTDNTREGAAHRIIYMLKYGVPDHWAAQMHGTAERVYSTPSVIASYADLLAEAEGLAQ